MLAIKTLLKSNVFQFRDTFYRQNWGGVMGSPFNWLCTMLTFVVIEILILLPQFKNNIIISKIFVDDMFVIWKKTKKNMITIMGCLKGS